MLTPQGKVNGVPFCSYNMDCELDACPVACQCSLGKVQFFLLSSPSLFPNYKPSFSRELHLTGVKEAISAALQPLEDDGVVEK